MKKNIKNITAALVGDPNTGKSTFFNAWTGLHQITGNWPGVTVEKHLGQIKLPTGEDLTLVDLPGIYSLHAISIDESIAANYVRSHEPDLIINIVDAVNLERNLYLTTALMELGKPMVMVLSMTDILKRQGFIIDTDLLSERLGIPVVSAAVQTKANRKALEKAVVEALAVKQKRPVVVYPESLNQAFIKATREGEPTYHTIHRLEGILPGAEDVIDQVEETLGTTPDVLIADARYDFIASATKSVVRQVAAARTEIGRAIDSVALNRWLGIPIFLGIMYILFWLTQVVGGCFIDFFDILGDAIFVTGLGNVMTLCGAPEWAITLLAGGLGAGIQTVMTFIPPVFFIFMGLSILEDSGYMARAAYVVDRFMRLLGLPGNAFVPMLVGFGCTVPAIMATRTLSNRRDRLLTIFMAPFMSCGARLPVYALFGAAFFGVASGSMVFAIYMSGILLSLFTGLLLKHTLFVGEPAPFVMELPLYHIPRVSTVFKQAWERLRLFLFRAGKVMALMVLVLAVCDAITVPNPFKKECETPCVVATTETTPKSPESKISVVELAGRTMAPLFKPMGVEEENWQGSVALIVGLFAKEQVVSALGTLYSIEEEAEEESEEALTWASTGTSFTEGIAEAFASIPEAFGGLLGGFFDAFGFAVFQSDYQIMMALVESAEYPALAKMIDAEGAATALAEAQAALTAGEEGAEDALAEAEATFAQASQLASMIHAAQAGDKTAVNALLSALEALHEDALASDGADADRGLLEALRNKFGHDAAGRNRAFAYLLFVLLYVPCLAAMATVVREIGWMYSNILFGYLTLLGWCVATLYFQITTGHQFIWILIPILLLVGTAAFFCAFGKKHKVKLVV